MSVRPYPAYKDSGEEWIGEVPASWDVCALNYRYEVALGKMLDEKRVTGAFLAPYLRNTDVQWGRINTVDLPTMDFAGDDLIRYALRRGDLLVCEGGEVGRAAIWEGGLEPCFYQKALHRLRPRRPDLESPNFLFYILRGAASRGIFAGSEGRSTIAHLTAEALRRYRFPFPPPAEQSAIAAFLDRETGKIDALVAEQERLMALLKEKRQAVISQAVTKGLNPNAPMKPSGVEWLGDVPEGWEVTRLKFLAHVQGGIAKGRDVSNVITIEVPYLRVANVQDGYLDLNEITMIHIEPHELDRYALRAGDVLMNEGGDFDKLGRGAIWHGEIDPCIHQNHVFAVRPYDIEPEWVTLVTSADYGRFFFMSYAKQSTNLASISSTNLQEIPVVCPPRDERLRILEHVKVETAKLDTLTTEATRAIGLLKERRAALISAAVTGKIDLRGLAPPAEAAA